MSTKQKVNPCELSADDLYSWIRNNVPMIDPMEPGEWFLHAYGSGFLLPTGEIPQWGLLGYRAELCGTIYTTGGYADSPVAPADTKQTAKSEPAPMPYVATGRENLIINDADGNTIALGPGAHLGLDRAKATTALICRAVNCHNDLVTTLRDIIDARDRATLSDDPAYVMIDRAIESARDVVAKACP